MAAFNIPNLDLHNKLLQLKAMAERKCEEFFNDVLSSREKMKDLVKTNYDLGLDHMRRGNFYDAMTRFKVILFLKPHHELACYANYQLGRCELLRKHPEKAITLFRKALQLKPDFPEVSYFLATLGELPPPTAIPLAVIADYFNMVALHYNEDMLLNQNYTGHAIIADALLPRLEKVEGQAQVLDLGSGTGLCGEMIKEKKPFCVLTGIDLSLEMVVEAHLLMLENVALYDFLKHTDMMHYVTTTEKKYHAVMAGLSLHYLGDLTAILTAIKAILLPGGTLTFTVTASEKEGFHLTEDMTHFCYSQSYIQQVASSIGYTELVLTEQLLQDNGLGLLCSLASD